MWQLLPFDDLARYQQMGYDTRTEWIWVAGVLGLISGIVLALISNEVRFDVAALAVALIAIIFLVEVIRMNEATTAPYIYAEPYKQIEVQISYLRASACIIAFFLWTLIAHVGTVAIQNLAKSRY